jgi:hypothetical protein
MIGYTAQNTGHESGDGLLAAPNRTASAFGERSDAARVYAVLVILLVVTIAPGLAMVNANITEWLSGRLSESLCQGVK